MEIHAQEPSRGYVAGMEDVIGGYRDPAPPRRESFALRRGTGAMVSLWATLGTSALSILLVLMAGDVFFLVSFALLVPGVFCAFWGAPARLEVGHDVAILHPCLGAPTRIPTSELSVRYDDFKLVLHWRERSVTIDAEQFPDESLRACVSALETSGARVVDARSERRRSVVD